jgi:hypothetical protein
MDAAALSPQEDGSGFEDVALIDEVTLMTLTDHVGEQVTMDQIVRVEEHHVDVLAGQMLSQPCPREASLSRLVQASFQRFGGRRGEGYAEKLDTGDQLSEVGWLMAGDHDEGAVAAGGRAD